MTNFLYVPRLRKNLVSIAVLEDYGYDGIFRKGNVFLRHIAMGWVKYIGIRVKNMNALEVKDTDKYLGRKEEVSDLVIEREHKLPLNMQPQKQSQKVVEQT